MTGAIGDRVAREKLSYNEGDVFAESAKLQRRFHHVFSCPNTLRLELYFSGAIQKYAPGGDVLDYGCLDGAMTPFLRSTNPNSVTGIDISDVAIADAIEKHGSNAKFLVADAHNTPFEDRSFDLVVGRSILHHLDWEVAIGELDRILRPGGTAIFTEPLADNPGAKLIRWLTPKARTTDEAPLTKSQISLADKAFGGGEHLFINLISVPVAMATSLIMNSPDGLALKLADRADVALARTPIRYWMRSVVLVWRKTKGLR